MEIFYGCAGVAVIILALGAVHSIPRVLGMIERISLNDPRTRRPGPPPAPPAGPPDAPWGRWNGD